MNKRNSVFEISKFFFLGIIVLGHIWGCFANGGFSGTYMGHLPVSYFGMLSAFFICKKSEEISKQDLRTELSIIVLQGWRRWWKWIPYTIISNSLLYAILIKNGMKTQLTVMSWIKECLLGQILGQDMVYNGPLWYMSALVFDSMIVFGMIRFLPRKILLLISMFGGMFGIYSYWIEAESVYEKWICIFDKGLGYLLGEMLWGIVCWEVFLFLKNKGKKRTKLPYYGIPLLALIIMCFVKVENMKYLFAIVAHICMIFCILLIEFYENKYLVKGKWSERLYLSVYTAHMVIIYAFIFGGGENNTWKHVLTMMVVVYSLIGVVLILIDMLEHRRKMRSEGLQ